MAHETLQALYALDVAEAGMAEASKRWEWTYVTANNWVNFHPTTKPSWCNFNEYRRNPGIPWPKEMQPQPAATWPEDAPKWANWLSINEDCSEWWYELQPKPTYTWWGGSGGQAAKRIKSLPNWRDTLIQRPKLKKQKIDWSMVRNAVRDFWWKDNAFPSYWIAWNCDEETRGNPLPDGLMFEWYEYSNTSFSSCNGYYPVWDLVTRFRIIGIQEGWE